MLKVYFHTEGAGFRMIKTRELIISQGGDHEQNCAQATNMALKASVFASYET